QQGPVERGRRVHREGRCGDGVAGDADDVFADGAAGRRGRHFDVERAGGAAVGERHQGVLAVTGAVVVQGYLGARGIEDAQPRVEVVDEQVGVTGGREGARRQGRPGPERDLVQVQVGAGDVPQRVLVARILTAEDVLGQRGGVVRLGVELGVPGDDGVV